MDSLIYHNDRIIPLAEARLSPGQMGLLMGWGVFTTLRIYEGVPFAFDRHWDRMARDAERLSIELHYRQEVVWESIVKLAAANQRRECAARLRPAVRWMRPSASSRGCQWRSACCLTGW